MSEIITLQVGTASNRLGEALWSSVLNEAKQLGADAKLDVSLQLKNKRVIPRAVAFGGKGELHGQVASTKQEVSAWDGGVKTIAQEADVKPCSVLPTRSIVEVAEFNSFDPLNNFYDGLLSSDGKLRRGTMESAQDQVRQLLEECDAIQGIQCFVDMDSTWGGFATEILRDIREECPSTYIMCAGLDERYPLVPQVGLFDQAKHDGRRAINMASSMLQLHELCSTCIPISTCGDAKGSFSNLSPTQSDYTSLAASAWNSMSATYRHPRQSQMQMRNIVFPMRPSMKIMELSCLNAPPVNFFELDGNTRLELLEDASFLPKGVVDPSWNRPRKYHYQLLSLRGDSTKFSGFSTPTWKTKAPFDTYFLTNLSSPLPVQPTLPIFDNATKESVAGLMITDAIPKYLSGLAHAVNTIDRRVVHEFVQAGMSTDAIRELHSDMLTLSDSS